MKYRLIILILSSVITLAAIQLYNSNTANAIIQNPDQQVTMNALLATTSQSSFSPQTSNDTATANATTVSGTTIPNAQSVYTSQSITLPTSVKSFVWYIVDEAHENSVTEKHKKISDHNPDYLPTNVIIPEGASLSFLDADAPWDSPHPHTINILDSSSGNVVYSTGKLDYTNTSKPTILPAGKYDLTDTKFPWMKGTLP